MCRSAPPYLLAAIASIFVAGCSNARPSSISGNVTFDGETIQTGNIRLDPLEETPGFAASAKIRDGRYVIAEDQGLFAGNYMVAISATRPTGRTITGEGLPGEANTIDEVEQYIPPRYNGASELRVELSPGDNIEDFALALP